MKITSSRKPSASTRTLCKLLASFFNGGYFNRGKMGMGEVLYQADGSHLMVVGEYHGNPGSISLYGPDGLCVLSLYFTLAASKEPYPCSREANPSIEGKGELVPIFSELFQAEGNKEPSSSLKMVVSDDRMDFTEADITLFSLKIRSYRIFEGGGNCS